MGQSSNVGEGQIICRGAMTYIKRVGGLKRILVANVRAWNTHINRIGGWSPRRLTILLAWALGVAKRSSNESLQGSVTSWQHKVIQPTENEHPPLQMTQWDLANDPTYTYS